jgi:glycine/D-amino acid oxidase-like deaminating enzyme
MDLAAQLPFELASASRREEGTDVAADGLPLVGQLPGRPLAVACGFSGLPAGFAFAAARWVADSLVSGTDPTPDALRATRSPLSLPDV